MVWGHFNGLLLPEDFHDSPGTWLREPERENGEIVAIGCSSAMCRCNIVRCVAAIQVEAGIQTIETMLEGFCRQRYDPSGGRRQINGFAF